jgi:hypothetical protein
MALARWAKRLKTLKRQWAALAKRSEGFGFGATSAWVWGRVRLGLAPRRVGIGGACRHAHAARRRGDWLDNSPFGAWGGAADRMETPALAACETKGQVWTNRL